MFGLLDTALGDAGLGGLVILGLGSSGRLGCSSEEPRVTVIWSLQKVRRNGVDIVPEWVLVLFRTGTMSLRSGLGTCFVPEPDCVKHFARCIAYKLTILQTIDRHHG